MSKDNALIENEFISRWLSGSPAIRHLSLLIALAIALFLTWMAKPFLLSGTQVYSDFVAGLLAFEDYYKSGEFNLVLFFLLVSVCIFIGIWWLTSRIVKNSFPATKPHLIEISTRLSVFEVMGGLLGVLGARYLILGDFPQIAGVVATITLVAVVLYFTRIDWRGFLAASLLAPIWGFFAVLAVSAAAEAISSDISLTPDMIYLWACWGAIIACGVSILSWLFCRNFQNSIHLILQLTFPLFALRFFRIDFIQGESIESLKMSAFGTVLTMLLAVILTGFIIRDVFRSFRTSGSSTEVINDGISSAALIGLTLFVYFTLPPATPFQADNFNLDFHLGEMMLPWHQIGRLGATPYQEFVPIQGYLSLTIGFINSLFYEGNAFSFYSASSLTAAITAALGILIATQVVGKIWALCLIPTILPPTNRFYLVPVLVLLLVHPQLLTRPAIWCVLSPLLIWAGVLWNAASGAALAVAFLPIGIYQLVKALAATKSTTRGFCIAGFILSVLLILLFTPFSGTLRFILDNGSTSVIAHAMPYFLNFDPANSIASHFSSPWHNRLVFEIVRSGSWIVLVPVSTACLLAVLRFKLNPNILGLIAISAGYILFTLVMLPQSLGRVDPPPHLSRTGGHAMLALGVFVPIIFAYGLRFTGLRMIPLVIVGFLLGIPLAIRNDSTASLSYSAVQQVSVPSQLVRHEAHDTRLPGLERIYIQPAKLSEMLKLRDSLYSILKSDEGYVEFANRAIFHLAFDVRYEAPYPYVHAVNGAIQNLLIESLKKKMPVLIWLSPSFEIDRGSPSIRAYRVWRWLLLNGYRHVAHNGFGFLLRADRFAEIFPEKVKDSPITPHLISDSYRPELNGLPLAWGKSFKHLAPLVEESNLEFSLTNEMGINSSNGWYVPRYPGAYIDLSLSKALAGSEADYLLIELEAKGVPNPRTTLSLAWGMDGANADSPQEFKFLARPGLLIVPIASDPRWLLQHSDLLRLTFIGTRKAASWRVSRIAALKLRAQ